MTAATVAAFVTEAAGADHRQVMRHVINAIAEARGLPAPWPVTLPGTLADRLTKRLEALGDLATWESTEVGTLREHLLSSNERSTSGAWYTPSELARPVTEAALATLTGHLYLDDDPHHILSTSVLDPACGAGVFLIAADRFLAQQYAGMLYGTHHPAPLTVQAVLPQVMQACVYGIDTDPIAVDLAKSACWLACGGTTPIDWLDDNIVTGNALNGDLPPALVGRINRGALAVVGNPPYEDKAKGAAPWLEARRPSRRQPRTPDELYRPSLDEFRVPGQGRLEGSLSNLYVYFWR
ncbi:N-6 DNA methylase [Streptomyces sp. NBC_00687]|uniref:N-6 DNA methylase n=1 Tax=Streptomyces sp. NBC_00687 TaxID=2975807 RepID=UPI00225995F6|nr:N-6 DNA methylase [Streptomyces sp. NBC_00687]MCX4919920.1 SAM-dependent methyltransferase [Streptomyces sp. NBC_00687]